NANFPVPVPLVLIEAPAPPLFKISFEPLVPVEIVVVCDWPAALLNVIGPTATPAEPESTVTLRLAADDESNSAVAPIALGTLVGFQFAPVAQLPPPLTFQTCAAAGPAPQTTITVAAIDNKVNFKV